jgi:hypothetical protein
MTRYLLIIKGDIEYDPNMKRITCYPSEGTRECFVIKLKKEKVKIKGASKYIDGHGNIIAVFGRELLANGKNYWIRDTK